MISAFDTGGIPKYIWAVDVFGEVYEAKTKPDQEVDYHGYRISGEDGMRDLILAEWKRR